MNEESLYAELGKSKELQEELRQQLLIRESIRKDTEAFTPPAAAVTGLFDKLGYATPYSVVSGNTALKTPFWHTMFKRATVSIAVLALLTFGGYNLIGVFNDGDADSAIADSNSIVSESKQSNDAYQQVNEIKNVDEVAAVNNVKQIPTVSSYVVEKASDTKIVATEKTETVISPKTELLATNNSNSNLLATNYADNRALVNPVYASNPNSSALNMNLTMNDGLNNVEFTKSEFTKPSNISAYMKAMPMSSLDNNMPLVGGIRFETSKYFSIAIEGGRQTYSAIVTSDTDDNILINKNMPVNFVVIVGRYDVKQLEFLNVHPYVQIGVGAGNFGKYMYRLNGGIEYPLFESGISLMLGLEESNLIYPTQNKSYKTSNLDVIFGISYKF
ncbi:MAG: hypothetical protein CVV22_04365 [Ignavibacteriae bacterium HGW-Ignavibacteriae-1]|nr:MAG: hypothetical protein CVV22_04365 [Ignavibacteriae bacterium HGW-Ignavibacteriae-1]